MTLSEKELLAKVPTGLYIAGKWVQGSASQAIAVEDPATGKTLLEIANATAEDGLAALTAADEAQAKWARVAPRERAEILRRTFDLVRARSEEFAMLISLEMGNRSLKRAVRSPTATNSCAGSAKRRFESRADSEPHPREPGECWLPSDQWVRPSQLHLGISRWQWRPERLARRSRRVAPS